MAIKQILGTAGNDLFTARLEAESFAGLAGADTVSYGGSNAAVSVNLGTGKGSGGYAAGDIFATIEAITGSAYNDTLAGGAFAETLSGGAGNDLLYGSAGADRLDGGAGIDKVTYSASTAAVKVDLATGKGSDGYAAGDVLTGIEQVNGSKYNDTLIGGNGDETLAGLDGNDLIYGSLGVDNWTAATASTR